jgi:hypothetical protein
VWQTEWGNGTGAVESKAIAQLSDTQRVGRLLAAWCGHPAALLQAIDTQKEKGARFVPGALLS